MNLRFQEEGTGIAQEHGKSQEPLGVIIRLADRGRSFGVTRKALSELLNGHSGISPEMAVRLSKAFGGTPETWLRLQLQFDLAKIERRADFIRVTRFSDPALA